LSKPDSEKNGNKWNSNPCPLPSLPAATRYVIVPD